MNIFNNKRTIAAMASFGLCVSLVTGCHGARYSAYDEDHPSGRFPFYQSAPRPDQPYSEDIIQPPSTQPNSDVIPPVPGYTDPDIPPAPSAQRSKRGLTPSNFKFPSFSRSSNDIRQMAARTGDRLGLSAWKRNRNTQADSADEAQQISREVVQPQLPSLHTTPELPTPMSASAAVNDGSESTVYPKAVRVRTRNNRPSPNTVDNSNSTDDSPPRLLAPDN